MNEQRKKSVVMGTAATVTVFGHFFPNKICAEYRTYYRAKFRNRFLPLSSLAISLPIRVVVNGVFRQISGAF